MLGSRIDRPIQLMPIFRERIWGRESLAPYFPVTPRGERIGEVWFTADENLTSLQCTLGDLIRNHPEILGNAADARHPGICPLLVKLIFTDDRLSVQVHPDYEYAEKHHGSLGKTEAWYLIEAQPGSKMAIGFERPLSREALREAAQSGDIEQMLDWRDARAGDVTYLPAGTVHAMGGGLTICEIQENSDITYRLYDFGRGRELHLDHGIEVARLTPSDHRTKRVAISDWREELLVSNFFRIERMTPKRAVRIHGGLPHFLLLICIKGAGRIAQHDFSAGEAWLVPAQGDACTLEGADSEWIVTYKADQRTALLTEVDD